MTSQNNPYAGAGGQMTANVSFGSAPAAAGGTDLVKDTTTAGFQADVITESRNQPVLVDFWAPWCGPCKQLTPIIEKAVRDAGGAVKLVKMNIDDHPAIAGQLGIQSIPAVIAFVNGQPVDGFMGAVPESKVKEFIAKIGGPSDAEAALAEAITAANELIEAGDFVQASEIFSSILHAVPDNVDAIVGLATCLLESGDAEKAREILAQLPADKQNAPAVRALEARLALADQVKLIGDPIALEKRIQADPKDYHARFDLAQVRNAQGRREDAASELLFIMKSDREWNEDGARKQLLQFFEAWGNADPATLGARRKLSSLLFS
ncbi:MULTISPECIES: thioredoxin [Brucella/Ochrobactrum group]|uniref:Thioredoxin n=1 Tax=Brucella anthropi (strain ATCC 49188 / DSM 6882 / CCUG 24695 / JCM 21032 / LMG 3331 / NBRC 15819 / NCTC 12168 / Alc 37) TaxID=439375 RepID=A6X436_BRUA4|nr:MULTISPECIES: thioredoxin [Brucella/Ochrobactrum group]ABS15990.1 thioredoxin [Brucella anthropi ATCC 49188]AIK42067.1 thioredoxin [Brucella anthropi]KAB2742179.1 thioredoxin [Brucella anthropi]KAB2746398.1 thioredoxin [Brucella anthropi]KAB2754726.1 thioredoxin [Brucella anthropi]